MQNVDFLMAQLKLCFLMTMLIYEPLHDKIYTTTFVQTKMNSSKIGHQPSMINVFALRFRNMIGSLDIYLAFWPDLGIGLI